MSEETVTIPKDEYLELLRCKSALVERELAEVEAEIASPPKYTI